MDAITSLFTNLLLIIMGVKKVKRVKAPQRTISTSKDTVAYLKANTKRG